jgi:hypothetical protein
MSSPVTGLWRVSPERIIAVSFVSDDLLLTPCIVRRPGLRVVGRADDFPVLRG